MNSSSLGLAGVFLFAVSAGVLYFFSVTGIIRQEVVLEHHRHHMWAIVHQGDSVGQNSEKDASMEPNSFSLQSLSPAITSTSLTSTNRSKTWELQACEELLSGEGLLSPENCTWQPVGCKCHQYTVSEARQCFAHHARLGRANRIVFIGDSKIRYMYEAFSRHLGYNITFDLETRHSDREIASLDPPFILQMKHRPYVGLTMWRATFWELLVAPRPAPPSLVIAGAGMWHICFRKKENFSAELEKFKASFNFWLKETGKLLEVANSKVILAPMDPVLESAAKPRCDPPTVITNANVDEYNLAMAVSLVAKSPKNIVLWSSGREAVVQAMKIGLNPFLDGIHLTRPMDDLKVQMLLNVYCNEVMKLKGTCCRANADPQ